MSQSENWETPFEEALETIRHGDFVEVQQALKSLGFQFVQGKNPDHWMYFHPMLRNDPIFRYPRNLFRPHGSNRDSGRIANRDKSQAKQIVQALKSFIESSQTGLEERK